MQLKRICNDTLNQGASLLPNYVSVLLPGVNVDVNSLLPRGILEQSASRAFELANCRLCGYDPMPPLPQEARETLERSEEDSSAWQTGTQRRPGGFAELRPGVVRLTGAGYIGRGNAPEPRTPILTAEQEELILKMNVQVLYPANQESLALSLSLCCQLAQRIHRRWLRIISVLCLLW